MLTYHKVTGHKVGEIDTYANVTIRNNMELRFYDDGANYVGFEAPALTANQIWVLPTADGSATQVLRTDGSGTLSWASAAIGSGQVELDDTDASDQLIFDWSEASATDYTLDWKVNASNRTIDLSGNLTLSGTNTVAAWTVTGTTTLNATLTGVLRGDSGVVSVDSDVTDLVGAASTSVAGIVELAIGSEVNTGTSTTLAVTPDALEDWTGSAFITTLGTIGTGTWNAGGITASAASTFNNTITVGSDGTGHDVKLYSATASSYWLWDESEDAVVHAFVSDANTAETAHTITVTDATVQSANMHRGLVVGYTSSGAKTGTSYVAGINVDMTLSDASSGATAQAYGIATYITESGTPTIGTVVGVESYIEDLGVNAGALLGMDIGINSTNLATGRHSGIRIKNHSAMGRSAVLFEGGWTIGLDFTGTTSLGAASTITTDIMMTSGGLLNANTSLIDNAKGYCYDAETTATPSGAFTVDWTTKHVQRVTITGAALDVTFTDPPGPCKLTLVVVQGDGSDTIDWTNEASILFPGAVDPTLSTGSGDIDVLTFYFDGTSYLGLFNGNFG